MTREDFVRGYEIVRRVGTGAWGEARDPNDARNNLKAVALRDGANAVVSMTLNKYAESESCSNYKFTVHRYYGDTVIVKKTGYSSDPGDIERSNRGLDHARNIQRCDNAGISILVRPPAILFYPMLLLSWVRTLALIFGLIPVVLFCRLFSLQPQFMRETQA
jgi:hypothetical protein